MNYISKTAFTLVELLVVIAIVGILSGLIIVGMSSSTNSAIIAKSQIFSASLRDSLLMNLVSEWKFDDGSGSAVVDSWSGGNNGTLSNFTNTTSGYGDANPDGWMSSYNCISGTCLKFDGIDDGVVISNGTNLDLSGDFTIEVWAKSISTANNQMIVDKRRSGQNDYNVNYYLEYNYNSKILFLIGGGGSTWSLTQTNYLPSKDIWHLYVALKNGTNTYIYIDGVQQATGSCNFTPHTSATQIMNIGRTSIPNSFFNGSIDTLRIYNAAMATSYIKERYYLGLNKLLTSGWITAEEYKMRLTFPS